MDNWFGASGSAEEPLETGDEEGLQEQVTTFGEGSKPSLTSQAVPVMYPVTEGTNWWLGLQSTTPAQSDGSVGGPNRLLPSYAGTGGGHVAGQLLVEGREGLVPVMAGPITPGEPNVRSSSLAQEATTWLEGHSNAAGRPARDR